MLPPADHEYGYTQTYLRKLIGELRWSDFQRFIEGSTIGISDTGEPVYYVCDVRKFLSGQKYNDLFN